MFSGLFGGGMSSRLFQEVREKRGLCYAIYSTAWGLQDAGLFGIHAATGTGLMGELIDVIGAELKRAAEQGTGCGRAGALQGAAQGRPVDEPGKLVGAGRADGASRADATTAC